MKQSWHLELKRMCEGSYTRELKHKSRADTEARPKYYMNGMNYKLLLKWLSVLNLTDCTKSQIIRKSKYIYFQTTQDHQPRKASLNYLARTYNDQEQLVSEQYYGVGQEVMVGDSISHSN
jgi:hypothetical protein